MSSTKIIASPTFIILGSIIVTIIIGTLLLALPAARTQEIPFIDLFFTATSATCVTGLLTVSLEHFTFFGHCILLALIQIGGLGLITTTIFLVSLFMEFGLSTQLLAGKLLELESWTNIKKFIFFIIAFTVCVELIGIGIIFMFLRTEYDTSTALFLAAFHTVSSFCTAGITLFPDGMQPYATHYGMLLTTTFLMLAGGLGFITWHEVILRSLHKKRSFTLHSKIILYATVILTVGGALLFWITEHTNVLNGMAFPQLLVTSLFNVTSFRGGGFMIFNIEELQQATIVLIMILAFIGAGPGSTGSGIKLTTVAVYLAMIKAAISGRTSVEIRGRTIPQDQAFKAIAIISASIFWIIATTFCLLLSEQGLSFFDLFFEALSAFVTLGLSMGITASLTTTGKIFIVSSMIAGRIGSLALILVLRHWTYRRKLEGTEFSYPDERVLLS